MYVCMYVCMHVCMYACVCMYVYVQCLSVHYGLLTEAIASVWESQQRQCIQEPPDMSMSRVARNTPINGMDVPYYKRLCESNCLDKIHKALPNMIPDIG